MSLLENLVKQGSKFKFLLEGDSNKSPFLLQKKQLLKLLIQAKNTAFGKNYQFDKLIKSIKKGDKNSREFYEEYTKTIPIFDYAKIYNEWWYRDHQNGESDVCWKGKVGHYALSSGTSGGPTKYIPVTKAMMRSMRRTSLLQFLSVPSFKDIPSSAFSKGILMLTGSTDLQRKATHYEGDLSGINA
ncbi:MAG: GH3 auxin-responsive promoter, partial [Bacteroidetes bacterium]